MDKNKFIVYSRSGCPFCQEATTLLESAGESYDVISFDDSANLLEDIKKAYDWKTVPMVFKACDDGLIKFIGGCSDLKTYIGDAT